MATRWLCISTRANEEITRKKHVWGVSKRYANNIADVKIGDSLLMYTRHEIVNNEIKPSAIMGVYKATSNVYLDEKPLFITPQFLGNEVFPFRIKVEPDIIFHEPLPFKPLVQELSFIKNKTMWSGSIRTAMKVIPEEDYQKIMKAAGL
jgi:predicted RNA-binding protein